METVVYTQIKRVDPELISSLRGLAVADLHEAMGPVAGRLGLMAPSLRPLSSDSAIVGQAITAFNYPGDNLMIHTALYYAQPGDVLVLTNGGGTQGALWGENAAVQAVTKQIEGIVVEGSVRDTAGLREIGPPVWSTAISVSHPDKKGMGAVNIPVVCGGVLVRPGDIIVADADGVLVIPPRLAAAAAKGARSRSDGELKLREAIRNGKTLFSYLNIEASLKSLGASIREEAWRED